MEAGVREAPAQLERAHDVLLELVKHWPWSEPVANAVAPRRKRGRPLGCKDKEPRNRRGQGKRKTPSPKHIALTEWYIQRLKAPKKGRVDVWDTAQPGFGVRIFAAMPGELPHRVFIFGYQNVKGRREIDTIGACDSMGLHEAKRIARVMQKKVQAGIVGTSVQYRGDAFATSNTTDIPREHLSLKPADCIERHLEWFRRHRAQSTWKHRRTMFRHHITAWAEKFDSVRDITQSDIFDLFNSKPAELSNAMHNGVYDAIKAWFKHMHRVERIIEYNVTWGVGQPRAPSERTRWLTDDEIRWFWSACTAEGYPHGDFMKLLFLTAQRPHEVREMPLSELASYYDRHEWNLAKERTKPRRGHVIPISDFAAELVDGLLKRGNKDYLFVKRRGRPPGNCCKPRIRVARLMEAYRAQERLRQGLDPNEGSIPPWDLRDLRRTAATILARRKHALHVIDKALNHGSARTGTGRTVGVVTQVYVKYEYMDERREALQDLGEYIRKLVQP